MKKDYEVTFESAIKDMSARERIAVKALDRCEAIDTLVNLGEVLTITVENFVVLNVHNERAKEGNNKDYAVYVVIANDGTKYRTGSASFFNAFMDIYEELKDEEPNEPITIDIYKQESKNFKGKGFISCSLSD